MREYNHRVKGRLPRSRAYFVRAFRVATCPLDKAFLKLYAYTAFFAYHLPWWVRQ